MRQGGNRSEKLLSHGRRPMGGGRFSCVRPPTGQEGFFNSAGRQQVRRAPIGQKSAFRTAWRQQFRRKPFKRQVTNVRKAHFMR